LKEKTSISNTDCTVEFTHSDLICCLFLFRILGRRNCFHWQYCAQLFCFVFF